MVVASTADAHTATAHFQYFCMVFHVDFIAPFIPFLSVLKNLLFIGGLYIVTGTVDGINGAGFALSSISRLSAGISSRSRQMVDSPLGIDPQIRFSTSPQWALAFPMPHCQLGSSV